MTQLTCRIIDQGIGHGGLAELGYWIVWPCEGVANLHGADGGLRSCCTLNPSSNSCGFGLSGVSSIAAQQMVCLALLLNKR